MTQVCWTRYTATTLANTDVYRCFARYTKRYRSLRPLHVPLLPPWEERDRERRAVVLAGWFTVNSKSAPHPNPLPARCSRGEGEDRRFPALISPWTATGTTFCSGRREIRPRCQPL